MLHGVSREGCYFHDESKLSNPYDFSNVIDAVLASIRVVPAHSSRVMLSSSSEASEVSPTL